MKLIFATANRHKLEEVQKMMPPSIELFTPADFGITEDIPENEATLEGNASAKAHYIFEKTGCDCFADDTGLEIEALGGEPGVCSARYAQTQGTGTGHDSEDNMRTVLRKMEGIANRKARFRSIISLIIDGHEVQFEGAVNGTIRHQRSGQEGFGYDPIFEPDGYVITFAEMPLEEKNAISHRGRSISKLIDHLNSLATKIVPHTTQPPR